MPKMEDCCCWLLWVGVGFVLGYESEILLKKCLNVLEKNSLKKGFDSEFLLLKWKLGFVVVIGAAALGDLW